MKNKPYFPMFIDLSDKNIVVVGGGNIATRRVKTLLSFTRNIRVIEKIHPSALLRSHLLPPDFPEVLQELPLYGSCPCHKV